MLSNEIKDLSDMGHSIKGTYEEIKKKGVSEIPYESIHELDESVKKRKEELDAILSDTDHKIKKFQETVVQKLKKTKISIQVSGETDLFDSGNGMDIVYNKKSLSSYGKPGLRFIASKIRPFSYEETRNVVYIPTYYLDDKDNVLFLSTLCHEIGHSQNSEEIKKFVAKRKLENMKKYFEIIKTMGYKGTFEAEKFNILLSDLAEGKRHYNERIKFLFDVVKRKKSYKGILKKYLSDERYTRQEKIALDEVLAREKGFNIMKDVGIESQSIMDSYIYAKTCLACYSTRSAHGFNFCTPEIDSRVFAKNIENATYTLKCPDLKID